MRKFLAAAAVVIGLSIQACAVANCFASATTSGAGTPSSPINTTGASILIVVTVGLNQWPIVSDSAGNVWQTTALYNNQAFTQIRFAVPPITSASHTFTVSNNAGTPLFPSANIYACSGTLTDHPYSAVNGLLTSASSVAFQLGSVIPFEAGDLIISAAGNAVSTVTTATINSGFNTPLINNGGGGSAQSVVSSWISAPNTSALNPTWTTTVATWSGVNAVFKASTATPPAKSNPAITTAAGDGGQGYAGDGGPALSAMVDYTGNIVITSLKLVCFADINNNRIRCFNPTNSSITQYGVTIAAGNINTIAGNGTPTFVDNVAPLSAGLIHPVGLAIDSNDCMYVADQQSAAIRKFCTTGNMTTIAGRGPGGTAIGCSGQPVAGFSGDGGPATSALLDCPQGVTVNLSGTIVYASDSLNGRIRAINTDSITHVINGVSIGAGHIDTVFGNGGSPCGLTSSGTTSIIGYPLGIKLTVAGTLVVTDFNCQNVVRLTSAGVPSLVAGNGTAGYVDNVVGSSAEFNGPFDVEILNSGDILIADANNSTVRIWNHVTTIVSTFAGNHTLYPYTNGFWISGGYSGDGSASRLAGLMYPIGLVKDGRGNIYVADLGNERIRYLYGIGGRITNTGIKVTSRTKMQ